MVENLRKLRKKKGISQKALGELLGTTQQNINKYENHKIEPDIYMLTQMADFFETSVDYLIGHTDIDRKIEPVQRYDLNAEESDLIDEYRLLTPDERESIRLVMKNYLK